MAAPPAPVDPPAPSSGPDPDHDLDAALMLAFAAGDAAAFDQLYARHQQALYRFVGRMLGRERAAQTDEVFQDTWLRVVHARQNYRPGPARFRTWLFTLAHHRAIDTLRRSGRELPLGDGPADEGPEPYVPDGAQAWSLWPGVASADSAEQADRVFWRRAGEQLLRCLDELPAAQRAAFLLHHEDGLTVDDLAQALEIGFETAKSRLRYALAKLRVCMGAYLDPIAPRPGATA